MKKANKNAGKMPAFFEHNLMIDDV